MVKIRLSRAGVKKRPFYQVIVADSRYPRNGKFIEKVGFFNPIPSQNSSNDIYINYIRIKYWIQNGASMSSRVKYLIKKFFQNKK